MSGRRRKIKTVKCESHIRLNLTRAVNWSRQLGLKGLFCSVDANWTCVRQYTRPSGHKRGSCDLGQNWWDQRVNYSLNDTVKCLPLLRSQSWVCSRPKMEKQGNKGENSDTITVCILYDWVTVVIKNNKTKHNYNSFQWAFEEFSTVIFMYVYDCDKLYSATTLFPFNEKDKTGILLRTWQDTMRESGTKYYCTTLLPCFPCSADSVVKRIRPPSYFLHKKRLQRAHKNTAVSLQVKQLRPKSHQRHFFLHPPPIQMYSHWWDQISHTDWMTLLQRSCSSRLDVPSWGRMQVG